MYLRLGCCAYLYVVMDHVTNGLRLACGSLMNIYLFTLKNFNHRLLDYNNK